MLNEEDEPIVEAGLHELVPESGHFRHHVHEGDVHEHPGSHGEDPRVGVGGLASGDTHVTAGWRVGGLGEGEGDQFQDMIRRR